MKTPLKRKLRSVRLKEEPKRDLISALEEIEARRKTRLRVPIPFEVARKLEEFLRSKGLYSKEATALIIEYGLSGESDPELRLMEEERKEWLSSTWGRAATMKFQAYELYMENRMVTMTLGLRIKENRKLKKRLESEGLEFAVGKGEWSEARLEEFQKRYLFPDRK